MHATAPLESAIRKDAALECCEAGFTHHDATSSSAGLIAVQPTTSDLQYTKPGVHAPAIVLALVGKRIVSDGAVDHCDDECFLFCPIIVTRSYTGSKMTSESVI